MVKVTQVYSGEVALFMCSLLGSNGAGSIILQKVWYLGKKSIDCMGSQLCRCTSGTSQGIIPGFGVKEPTKWCEQWL